MHSLRSLVVASSALVALASGSVLAQAKSASAPSGGSNVEKGTITIGTSLNTFSSGPRGGLSITSGGGTSVTNFGFNGAAGYVINSNLEIGGNVLLSTTSGGGSSNTAFGIGPYARYWLNPAPTGSFNFGGQINIFSPGGGASNTTNFGVFGGYSFFVNKGFSVDLQVPIQIQTGGGSNQTSFGLLVGVTGWLR